MSDTSSSVYPPAKRSNLKQVPHKQRKSVAFLTASTENAELSDNSIKTSDSNDNLNIVDIRK